MALEPCPLQKAYRFLEPGPTLLVTTRATDGRANIMTICWHMVLDFSPRFALATGPWNFSFRALTDTRECVLAVPGVDLAEKTVRIGDCSGKTVDKFRQFGLTPLPAAKIGAPLIGECLACVECQMEDYLQPSGIVVLRGVAAWVNPSRAERRTFHGNGDGTFTADGETFNLRHCMEDKLPPGV